MRLDRTSIAPGAVAVCKDAGPVRKLAAGADAVGEVSVVGSFRGKLQNEGETLTLLDAKGRIADQIAYDAKNAVVKTADDTRSSLSLRPLAGGLRGASCRTPRAYARSAGSQDARLTSRRKQASPRAGLSPGSPQRFSCGTCAALRG